MYTIKFSVGLFEEGPNSGALRTKQMISVGTAITPIIAIAIAPMIGIAPIIEIAIAPIIILQ